MIANPIQYRENCFRLFLITAPIIASINEESASSIVKKYVEMVLFSSRWNWGINVTGRSSR